MAAVTQIGLDIGSTCVRAVETHRGKDGQTLQRFGQVPLPPAAVQGGVIQDEATVSQAVRQLWSSTRFQSKDVVLGITNPQVVVREMTLTNLPPRELRASLAFQVRDALPLPVEKCVLDFQPLENPGSNKSVRGLLIAAPKEAVLSAVRAVEAAGLRVARVDLSAFAVLRAASQLDSEVEAIVDIGADSTSVIVHSRGEPLIVRTVPRGGAEVTDAIAADWEVSSDRAEELKRRVGLNAETDGRTAGVVTAAVRPLVAEIRGSFNYLAAGDRQAQVQRLALCGGGAQLPGFVDFLAVELGVDVSLADPIIRLREAPRGRHNGLEQFRPFAAVSVGLTLGAA